MIKLPEQLLLKPDMNPLSALIKKPFVKWLSIIFGVAIFVFVIILASIFLELSGPINTANQQFSDIKKGNFQAAYDLLSINEKAKTSLNEFALNFSRLRISSDKNSRLFFNNRQIVDNQAKLTGVLVTNGTSITITYVLIQENGSWKISDFNLSP